MKRWQLTPYIQRYLLWGGAICGSILCLLGLLLALSLSGIPLLPKFLTPKTSTAPCICETLAEKALGPDSAPVIVVAYSSLTCGHCATFHEKTLPALKEKYIEPGKVKFVFRDFPFDRVALKASMLAHCNGTTEDFFATLDHLYATQSEWLFASDPERALMDVMAKKGMTPTEFKVCTENESLMDKILEARIMAEKTHGIHATPTFLINEHQHVGVMDFDSLKAEVEEALATETAAEEDA